MVGCHRNFDNLAVGRLHVFDDGFKSSVCNNKIFAGGQESFVSDAKNLGGAAAEHDVVTLNAVNLGQSVSHPKIERIGIAGGYIAARSERFDSFWRRAVWTFVEIEMNCAFGDGLIMARTLRGSKIGRGDGQRERLRDSFGKITARERWSHFCLPSLKLPRMIPLAQQGNNKIGIEKGCGDGR